MITAHQQDLMARAKQSWLPRDEVMQQISPMLLKSLNKAACEKHAISGSF